MKMIFVMRSVIIDGELHDGYPELAK